MRCFSCLGFLFVAATLLGAGAGEDPAPQSDLMLWYRQPADAWIKALPIGNGRFGAMVFGQPANERLQLNDVTVWSGDPAPGGAWTGLELGANSAAQVTAIACAPRVAGKFPERMLGGKFQGANTPDFRDATDLHTVNELPKSGMLTTHPVTAPGRYRYLRYLSPTGGSCNIAELAFISRQ